MTKLVILDVYVWNVVLPILFCYLLFFAAPVKVEGLQKEGVKLTKNQKKKLKKKLKKANAVRQSNFNAFSCKLRN